VTLLELSTQYEQSAAALRSRISELRQAERIQEDEDRARALRLRIAALLPLLRECREIAHFTAHYYDRSDRTNEPYTL